MNIPIFTTANPLEQRPSIKGYSEETLFHHANNSAMFALMTREQNILWRRAVACLQHEPPYPRG